MINSSSFSPVAGPQGLPQPENPPPKPFRPGAPPTIKALTYDLSPAPTEDELSQLIEQFGYFAFWSAFRLSEAGHKLLPPYAGAFEGDIALKGAGFVCGAIDALSGFNGVLRRSHADTKIAALHKGIADAARQLASLPPHTQQSQKLEEDVTRQCKELALYMG